MSSPPIYVKPDTSVAEIADLLTKNRISGVPVVDEEMRVVGIVTEADLFLKQQPVPFSLVRATTLLNRWVPPESVERVREELEQAKAEDVMTRAVICADIDQTIGEVARVMVQHDVKRVPVTENGKLVGMLTRYDMIRRMAQRRR
jgi:CBS domain-containing protein